MGTNGNGNGNGNGRRGSIAELAILGTICIVVVSGLVAASVSDTGSVAILGFCGIIAAQLFAAYQQRRTAEEARQEAARTAMESKQAALVIANKIEVVHKAANSLVDKLVNKTEQEALARGAKDEKEKHL